MRRYKPIKPKNKQNQDQLPSFLQDIPSQKDDSNDKHLPNKGNVGFLGPIFFGGCDQHHPIPHCLDLDARHVILERPRSREHILPGLRAPKGDAGPPKIPYPFIKVQAPKKRKSWEDAWPHQAPGRISAAGPPYGGFFPALGETKSKIKAEVDVESSPCHRKPHELNEDRLPKAVIKARRRTLTPAERAAHVHFRKDRIVINLVGPPIPDSIIVGQLKTPRMYEEEKQKEKLRAAMKEKKESERRMPTSVSAPETEGEEDEYGSETLSEDGNENENVERIYQFDENSYLKVTTEPSNPSFEEVKLYKKP